MHHFRFTNPNDYAPKTPYPSMRDPNTLNYNPNNLHPSEQMNPTLNSNLPTQVLNRPMRKRSRRRNSLPIKGKAKKLKNSKIKSLTTIPEDKEVYIEVPSHYFSKVNYAFLLKIV